MMNRLPPITALRAFEAAARHENFSRAADEIHVTHGAVSHQVRALETFVGVRLFTRQGRGVVLTGDGRALAAAIRTGLAQIAEAAQSIRRRASSNRLTISVLPSFGSRWLMPRIGRFMAEHPDWSVNIDSSPTLVDFARDDVDIAVRFGRGPWRGLHGELLMEDTYVMVASPSLNGGRLPKRLADLADLPMLRTDREPWDAWCAAAGVDLKMPDRGVGYEDMGVMLQSAIDGLGVMLTRRVIAATEIERGTLRQLFDVEAPSDSAYWLVWPEDHAPSDRLLAFRDWIHAEAARSAERPPANARNRAGRKAASKRLRR